MTSLSASYGTQWQHTRLRRTCLLRNFKLSNLSYNTQNPAFNPQSRIARMRGREVTMRLPRPKTLSKTLTTVSIPSRGLVLVAMPVARPTLPVISSAAVLHMSPNTHFVAQGAGADIEVLDRRVGKLGKQLLPFLGNLSCDKAVVSVASSRQILILAGFLVSSAN